MENQITLKIYDIDYSFIIKNYLDKELWQKVWTLYIYKDLVFTLSLQSIETKSNCIVFEIRINKTFHYTSYNWYINSNYKAIRYYLSTDNINILKKQINGAIFELMTRYEDDKIHDTDEYNDLVDYEKIEKEKLEKIAIEFLDSEGVTNDEIRDVYINNYIDNNTTISTKIDDLFKNLRYKIIPETYLTFLEITEDEQRKNTVLEALNDEETIREIMIEVNEHMQQLETEEYQEELKKNLESIY